MWSGLVTRRSSCLDMVVSDLYKIGNYPGSRKNLGEMGVRGGVRPDAHPFRHPFLLWAE